jgi:hypothetical protein
MMPKETITTSEETTTSSEETSTTFDGQFVGECFKCDSNHRVLTRYLRWDYRPRNPCGTPSSQDEILEIDLCEDCYEWVADYDVETGSSYTIGHDWWDAYDGIADEIQTPGLEV